MPLNTKVRDSYQQNLAYLQLVIIDEMSMVKADDLYKIDMRLREIKSNHDDFFGGVAVMFLCMCAFCVVYTCRERDA